MALPGFTAERCLSHMHRDKFGLIYTHINASMDIVPLADLCGYRWFGCNKLCRAAGKKGEEYMFCMCDCAPQCFCNFP